MTIKELYEWAAAHGVENLELYKGYWDDNYYHYTQEPILKEDLPDCLVEKDGKKIVEL